jgi:hypothetical protein
MIEVKLRDDAGLYQQSRMAHWNMVAQKVDTWKAMGGYYHKRLREIYKFLVPPGQKVLEIGCAQGIYRQFYNPL